MFESKSTFVSVARGLLPSVRFGESRLFTLAFDSASANRTPLLPADVDRLADSVLTAPLVVTDMVTCNVMSNAFEHAVDVDTTIGALESSTMNIQLFEVFLLSAVQYTKGGQPVFNYDRLENSLITRDRPVGYKDTSRKCHKMQWKGIFIKKCSFQVSCQFNAKSRATDQLRLDDRPVNRDRRVGHPSSKRYNNTL